MPATDTSTGHDVDSTLHVPVPQLDEIPDWGPEYVKVTPEIAKQWLDESGQDETFRNRKLNLAEKRKFVFIMRTNRFAHWVPDGPICFDEKGILLNGKTRLNAVAESGVTCGFMVFRGVPNWMFDFMGLGKPKNNAQILDARYKMSKPAVTAAMKLVLRYEEFLLGKRPAIGWRHWKGVHDQPSDIDLVYDRREDLVDYYDRAMAVRRGCKLLAVPLMLFQYYQWYAWPEGQGKLDQFLDSLTHGSDLAKGSAALSLYNFERDNYLPYDGKQQMHLILLFRHFGAHAKGEKLPVAKVGYGNEMLPPYHPKGPAAAKENLWKALTPLDAPR